MTAKRALPPGLVPVLLILAFAAAGLALPAAAEEMVLDNGRIRAEFDDRGLVSIGLPKTGRSLSFSADPSSVSIDGEAVPIGGLGPAEIEMTPVKVAYRYTRDPYTFDVVYELKPAWDFLTKQIIVASARSRVFHVDEVRPLETTFGRSVAEELKLKDGTFGAVCRFGGSCASAGP
ncbi:MAG: hypothetical protein NTX99_09425, partial [Candidatus Aminicenantes bacterium]|nr:hypothetical protein [Candidatus Aminicenantes bacterium]